MEIIPNDPVVNEGQPASKEVPAPEVTPPPEPENKAEQPERTFTQKELDEIVQKRAAQAERRAAKIVRAEVERDYYKQQLEQAQRPSQQDADKEPDPKDFQGNYEAFLLAKTRHAMRQELQAVRKETAEQFQSRELERQALQESEMVRQSIADAPKKYADFQEVALDPTLPVTPAMGKAIAKSGVAGDLLYHLGSNRDEAERIASLDAVDQVLAIAELKAKLGNSPAPTKVPAPIVPNKGSAREGGYRPGMSDKEFNDWRRRQIAQKR